MKTPFWSCAFLSVRAGGTLCAALVAASAMADPVVPGLSTSLYSSLGVEQLPYTIALDDAGALYAASDNNDVLGRFILRVPPGGGGASRYSLDRIFDPDGVLVDRTGSFSGVRGAVLVGCTDVSAVDGRVRAVRPDGTDFTVAGPSLALANNDAMAFDSLSRLYINAYANRTIVRFNGTTPTVFASLPPGIGGGVLAIDHLDRVWISCGDGAVRRYSSAGALEATIVVGGSSPGIGFSAGGEFARGVYVVDRSTGVLSRVSVQDQLEPVGSGFGSVYHLVFDVGGAMFAAGYDTGEIWKIGGCGADFNGDGFVDFFDFDDFVAAFETGLPSGDFNRDGFIDFFDSDDFVAAFEAGC
jgi:hypothetical protein